jgi:hypothetical protein
MVELTGVVEANFQEGLGYPFKVDNSDVKNPIFMQRVVFTGTKLNAFGVEEEALHNIPFGSRLIARGSMVIQDKARCTQTEYAEKNPKVCTPEGFRLKLAPDAIFSLPLESDKTISFSIFGKIKNIEAAAKTCPNNLEICEGLDLKTALCHPLVPSDMYCNNISDDPNMYLVKGYIDKESNSGLNAFEAFKVRGMSYTNAQFTNHITQLIDQSINSKKSGTVTLYNQKGEEVTKVNTKQEIYYDLEQVLPTQNTLYYIVKGQLYKKTYDDQPSLLLGKFDPKLIDPEAYLYGFQTSEDGNTVVFTTAKQVKEVDEPPYVLRTQDFFFFRINLNQLKPAEIINPEIVYQEQLTGFINLHAYDLATNTLLISHTLATEQQNPCQSRYFSVVDLTTKTKKEVGSFVDNANKYCGSALYRLLFVSKDGKNLFLGSDFNNNAATPRPTKLTHIMLNGTKPLIKEYLAQYSLIQDWNLQIRNISDNKLQIFFPHSDELFYTFDLSNEEFSTSNLSPLLQFPETSEEQIGSTYPRDFLYLRNFISTLNLPKLISENSDNWFILSNAGLGKQLHIVKKNTYEWFLAATFSIRAKSTQIGSDFFIIDAN